MQSNLPTLTSNLIFFDKCLCVYSGSSQAGQTSESGQSREEEPEKEEGGFFSKLKKMFT